jgi:HJR/Mrr/RecB family endonuclease
VLVVAAALALGSLPLGLLGVVAVAVGLVGTAGRPAARAGDPGVRALMEAVDRLSTTQYGALLSNLFTSLGYRVGRLVGPSAAGAELVLDRAGRRTVVHTGRRPVPVRREAVDKLASARDGAGAARALVVTTSAVTPKARTLAQRRRVEIWDRDRLARELARARRVPDPPPVQRLVAEVSAGLGRVGRGARSVASADRAGPR